MARRIYDLVLQHVDKSNDQRWDIRQRRMLVVERGLMAHHVKSSWRKGVPNTWSISKD